MGLLDFISDLIAWILLTSGFTDCITYITHFTTTANLKYGTTGSELFEDRVMDYFVDYNTTEDITTFPNVLMNINRASNDHDKLFDDRLKRAEAWTCTWNFVDNLSKVTKKHSIHSPLCTDRHSLTCDTLQVAAIEELKHLFHVGCSEVKSLEVIW